MLYTTSLLALAATAAAQISNESFENGWDKAAWPIYAPDCNQGGKIALDSTQAHTGKNSMRVDGAGGFCGHQFFGTKKVPSGDLYVRTWMKASKPLTAAHISFITMPDTAQGTNKHLRIGGQNSILMFNRESDDATLPDLSPQGVAASQPLKTGAWQCFEYHVSADGNIEAWMDDKPIAGLSSKAATGAQWARKLVKPRLEGVYFGWESYSGDVNTMWYDDISVAGAKIGCK